MVEFMVEFSRKMKINEELVRKKKKFIENCGIF
jgi:hypothetical protein